MSERRGKDGSDHEGMQQRHGVSCISRGEQRHFHRTRARVVAEDPGQGGEIGSQNDK